MKLLSEVKRLLEVMQYHHGNTVCISSQVGCRMGCAFCASTVAGKVRDLTAAQRGPAVSG